MQQQQLRAHMLWLGRILVVATTHLLQAVVSAGLGGHLYFCVLQGLGLQGLLPGQAVHVLCRLH